MNKINWRSFEITKRGKYLEISFLPTVVNEKLNIPQILKIKAKESHNSEGFYEGDKYIKNRHHVYQVLLPEQWKNDECLSFIKKTFKPSWCKEIDWAWRTNKLHSWEAE